MHSNKKIVAFDLDGTLAPSKGLMDEKMKEALIELSKIKKIVVISGGSFGQFEKQFLPIFDINKDERDLLFSNLYLLPTSGSKRYEFDNSINEWIVTDTEEMPSSVRNRVFHIIENIIKEGKYKMTPIIPGDNILEDRGTQITISALGQHAPLENKKNWDPDQTKRKEIKMELEKILPEVEIGIGGTTSIDILPKGFNKAQGLIRLLNKLNLQKEEMLFIGDAIFPGGNDYSPYEAGIECIKTSGEDETLEIINNLLKPNQEL